MWRRKKFIFIALLTIVVLAGSIGGVVFAQTEDENGGQPETLLDRVAGILADKGINVTSEQLNEAFTQARSEITTEARDSYLQDLVGQGKITQEQADQYKTWLDSKPDVPFGPPDGGPFAFGPRGHGGFRGFGPFGGEFRGGCEPPPTPPTE